MPQRKCVKETSTRTCMKRTPPARKDSRVKVLRSKRKCMKETPKIRKGAHAKVLQCSKCKEQWTANHFRKCQIQAKAMTRCCARCEAGDSDKLNKQYQCVKCKEIKELRDYAPVFIKQMIFRGTETKYNGGSRPHGFKCESCQYPKCQGLNGEGCREPNAKLFYPVAFQALHNGKYLCTACKYPPCACGRKRPLKSDGQRYHSDYSAVKGGCYKEWKCEVCQTQQNNAGQTTCRIAASQKKQKTKVPSIEALRIANTTTPVDANVIMQVMKYCDSGKILHEDLSEQALALIRVSHEGMPSVFFKQQDAMGRFAQARGKTNTMDKVLESYKAKFVYVDAITAERDSSLAAKNSGYFLEFSKEAIHDFIKFMDDFVKFMVTEDAENKGKFLKLPAIDVVLPCEMIVDLKDMKTPPPECSTTIVRKERVREAEDGQETERVGSEDDMALLSSFACKINIIYKELPRSVLFSLPPPTFPKGHVNLTIDAITSDTVSLIASGCGNLKAFMGELKDNDFVRKSTRISPDAKYPKIFWIRDGLPIDDILLTQFEDRILSKIFHNVPIKVIFRNTSSKGKGLQVLHEQISALNRVMIDATSSIVSA